MDPSDLIRSRLSSQQITSTRFEQPGDLVGWLGAVQAQDFLGSLWAIGLRLQKFTEAEIERAITERTIIRSWPMRGTLHFMAPADVRWMLELMTQRVLAGNARRLQRQYGLDEAVYARSRKAITRALQGGKQLSRSAVYQTLEAAGISAVHQRGLHILWWLAQEGLICFGPRSGKQPTFVLLDEWIPTSKKLGREDALAELTQRYFTSHGPATVQDFAWWSGLTIADALTGLELVKPRLVEETIDSRTYWLAPSISTANDSTPTAYLLPAFDEYSVAYKDRNVIFHPAYARQPDAAIRILNPAIVINGRAVGNWKRTLKKGSVAITFDLLAPLTDVEKETLAAAAMRFGVFLGLPVELG